MLLLYAFLLFAVAIIILAMTVSAVLSVSKPMDWSRQGAHGAADLRLIEDADRRQSQWPFVGRDRRKPQGDASAVKHTA